MSRNYYSILCFVLLLYASKKCNNQNVYLVIYQRYIYFFLIEPSVQQNLLKAPQRFMSFFSFVTN